MAKVIVNGFPGNLPYTLDYVPESDSPITLFFTGSAYAKVDEVKIGLEVAINGETVATSFIFSNGLGSHRAFVPTTVPYTFPVKVVNGEVQPVKITFTALNSETFFDQNDAITLMVI